MSTAKSKPQPRRAARKAENGAVHPQGTLTRQDIAMAIFAKCEGLSRREAKRIVDGVIEEMVATLANGETLKLHDFGSFVVRDKAERAGRNPRTGEMVPIQSRRVVVFKASPNMKATVNNGVCMDAETAAERSASAAARDDGARRGALAN